MGRSYPERTLNKSCADGRELMGCFGNGSAWSKKIAKLGSFLGEAVHTEMELGRLGFGSWDIGLLRFRVAGEAAFSSPFSRAA